MLDTAQAFEMSQSPLLLDRQFETKSYKASDILGRFKEGAEHLAECEPFVRAFASKDTAGAVLFAELKCGSWNCIECGPKLKWRWYERQMGLIIDEPALEQKVINSEDWTALHKKLNRYNAKYMTYDREDGRILVIATTGLEGEVITNKQESLIEAIESTPFTKQPISQSRNWKKKSVAKKKEETKWKPLDTSKLKTLKEVADTLLTLGYTSYDYPLETKMFGTERGLMVILKPEDYFPVLWKLGVGCRDKGERRIRGMPYMEEEVSV